LDELTDRTATLVIGETTSGLQVLDFPRVENAEQILAADPLPRQKYDFLYDLKFQFFFQLNFE
jgi:hypothetical protein